MNGILNHDSSKKVPQKSHPLDMLIFFVTGRCNASCLHCFYWQNLGADHIGLPLSDIEKIARSTPPFNNLLLSGGEPTLRADLADIIGLFVTNNKVRNVSVPTNGLLPDRIARLAEKIADRFQQINLSFNISIDGFAATHDVIRNGEGSYDKALQTLEKLSQLAKTHRNFRVVINTVIFAGNYDQVVPFAKFIESTGYANNHAFEIIRGNPKDVRSKSVPPDTLRNIYHQLVPIEARYISRDARSKTKGFLWPLREVMSLGNLIIKYQHQWKNYSKAGKWAFPCQAGEGIGVIDYNGNMRICELRMANVKLGDYDFNFKKAWASETIRLEAAVAKTHACDCTHTCFINVSMRQAMKSRFFYAPWNYLLFKLGFPY
jgi:Fe-coproporphyrin III synthase